MKFTRTAKVFGKTVVIELADHGSEDLGNQEPHVYKKGRICAESGCGTILNAYNGGSKCSLHRQPVFKRFGRRG